MLRSFPNVREMVEVEDVLPGREAAADRGTGRSHRGAADQPPGAPRCRHPRLGAEMLRRELLDLAESFRRHPASPGRGGDSEGFADRPPAAVNSDRVPAWQAEARAKFVPQANSTWDPARMAEWTEFHRKVGRLPPAQREVFDLVWYGGLTCRRPRGTGAHGTRDPVPLAEGEGPPRVGLRGDVPGL